MESLDTGVVTPFHTFDPLQGMSIVALVEQLEEIRSGGDDQLAKLSNKDLDLETKLQAEGVSLSDGRKGISWDDATLLFVAGRAIETDGGPAEPLERGISMERLGRFPTSNGNAIGYLREFLIPENDGDPGVQLLTQLDAGLRHEVRGHDELSIGFGGLILHGWLTSDEVPQLRNYLEKSIWKVAKSEPLDGGVREIVRHLLIILKSAEKRNMGILMRAH
ncbi:MAG: hypothetical protein QF454_04540 [Candidatus Thalassarchaeaceae archaeon]|nr:hypothetical protein [Candidatus Thalassarchaeaceae archaeon]